MRRGRAHIPVVCFCAVRIHCKSHARSFPGSGKDWAHNGAGMVAYSATISYARSMAGKHNPISSVLHSLTRGYSFKETHCHQMQSAHNKGANIPLPQCSCPSSTGCSSSHFFSSVRAYDWHLNLLQWWKMCLISPIAYLLCRTSENPTWGKTFLNMHITLKVQNPTGMTSRAEPKSNSRFSVPLKLVNLTFFVEVTDLRAGGVANLSTALMTKCH